MPLSDDDSTFRVRKLESHLINQIAAGEVLERPASCVKELVENSLDAGAGRIDVILTDGGLTEIVVLDDGRGIHPDDLLLCFERHATSKLREPSDLVAIGTFGFRGEALSSIAEVATVEVVTRRANDAQATRLRIAFGEPVVGPLPCGGPEGTRIAVGNLFERVPGRRKFLRSVGTELSHCARVLKEIALGNPEVAFSLTHQGRRLLTLVPSDRANRFREITRIRWEPVAITAAIESVTLEAWLAPPAALSERGELHCFINRRPIRDRHLQAIARSCYQELGGEPAGALYLDIRSDWVDVNVHPQKWEVRIWRHERLFPWVRSTLRKGLASAAPPSPAPEIRGGESLRQHPGPAAERALLGRLNDRYLLARDPRGLLIVDSRALGERRRFDRLIATAGDGALPSRQISPPRVLPLAREVASALATSPELFRRCGFELELYGDGHLLARALPATLPEPLAAEALATVSRSLEQTRGAAPQRERWEAALLALCGLCDDDAPEALPPGELDRLTGPDGRPLAMRVSFDTLSRHFERESP